MSWATVLADAQKRATEVTTAGFWTPAEWQDYYNLAAATMHRELYFRVSQIEESTFSRLVESDYFEPFVAVDATQSTVEDIQDYKVPALAWKILKVVVGTAPADRPAKPVPLHGEAERRLFPHFAPSADQPLYTIQPIVSASTRFTVRVYVSPGVRGVPLVPQLLSIYYLKLPTIVDKESGGAVDTDVPLVGQRVLVEHMLHQAMRKQYDFEAAAAYFQAYSHGVDQLIPSTVEPERK